MSILLTYLDKTYKHKTYNSYIHKNKHKHKHLHTYIHTYTHIHTGSPKAKTVVASTPPVPVRMKGGKDQEIHRVSQIHFFIYEKKNLTPQ